MLSFHSDLFDMGLTHSSGLPWSKASLLCHVFFTEDLCAHILTLPTHHCSHLPYSILLNSQGQFLYLSFYSTLKRYKRSHDWDENKITLWLITKIVSARTLGRSGEWDGGVNLCWRKPLIFINFIFFAHTAKVYGLGQCPGNFVMDKCNNRASYKW